MISRKINILSTGWWRLFLLSTVMFGALLFVPALQVSAQNPGDTTEKTSFTFSDCGDTDVSIQCLVDEVLTFATALVGIAVVAGITIGGIVYSMSRGNPANTQKGVKIITNSVIGLVLYFLMWTIIQFLVPGGIFS